VTGNDHGYVSQVDNIKFETTAVVSGPGGIALLAMGLAGIGFSRKNKIVK